MSFVDMTYGNLRRFWEVLFTVYCGSAGKATQMNEKLQPYAQLMYLTASMAYPRLPKEYHTPYVDKVRRLVLSRYVELLGSLTDALDD